VSFCNDRERWEKENFTISCIVASLGQNQNPWNSNNGNQNQPQIINHLHQQQQQQQQLQQQQQPQAPNLNLTAQIETINAQQIKLREQISQSENNLSAQKQGKLLILNEKNMIFL
jgi:hypothetical protein